MYSDEKIYVQKLHPINITNHISIFSIIYSSPNSDRFTKAFQTESTPTIDGDVLNDPAWELIPAYVT